MNVYRDRMMNVVRALREGRDEDFDMLHFGWSDCGTPACALGHYAARWDLQDVFCLELGMIYGRDHGFLPLGSISRHFGVTEEEESALFGRMGCGGAVRRQEAIDYLLAFIERKWPDDELERVPVMVGERELETA